MLATQANDSSFFYIMLPTFNRPDLVLRAVKSVISQDFKNYELIIFNDGSSESYAELEKLITSHQNIKYIKSINVGVNHSRNIMLDYIRSQSNFHLSYFFTLSDDDYLCENSLQIINDEIVKFKSIWYCFNCISQSKHIFENNNYQEYFKISYAKFRNNYQGDKHFIFKSSAFKNLNYPDKHFKNGYEHIFYTQIPSKIQVIPRTVKVIEYYEDGLSLSDLYDNANTLDILIKQIKSAPKSLLLYKMLLKYIINPKNIIKEVVTEDRYYKIKKIIGMKGKRLKK